MKTSIYLLLISFIGLGFLINCTSMDKIKRSPCFDGWTVDNTGSSVVWSPPNQAMELIKQELPQNRKIICVHKMPDGRIIVINSSDKKYATDFVFADKKYVIIDEGFIVTGHH